MKKENLNIDPQSIGERWYQYIVNSSKNWWQCIIPLIIIFVTTFMLNQHSSSGPTQQSDQLFFLSILLWLSLVMLYIERYYGYKILKRKLDEINNLKEK